MSSYVIGDVHGCYRSLLSLLDIINFKPDIDELLFLGDLVNKGPSSLEVLELVRSLPKARSVLGNHEFHLLMAYDNKSVTGSTGVSNDFDLIFESRNCDDLMNWIRSWPLCFYEEKYRTLLFHAAMDPKWLLEDVMRYSDEVSQCLQGEEWTTLVRKNHIQHKHRCWSERFERWDRMYAVINIMTRVRYWSLIEKNYDFYCTLPPGEQPNSLIPWYELKRNDDSLKLIFGHWASLMGRLCTSKLVALDGGCVWGGKLMAYCLDSSETFAVEVAVGEIYKGKNERR